jgi:hypothetical protein
MRVAELEGETLDLWVARAMGYASREDVPSSLTGEWSDGSGTQNDWQPSDDWAQGGPIIEREKIIIKPYKDGAWGADYGFDPEAKGGHFYYGSHEGTTPLIAAMRAYVCSKFGDEVEDAPLVRAD